MFMICCRRLLLVFVPRARIIEFKTGTRDGILVVAADNEGLRQAMTALFRVVDRVHRPFSINRVTYFLDTIC